MISIKAGYWQKAKILAGGLIWAAIAYWAYAVYQLLTVREVLNEELTMRLVIEGAGTTEAVVLGGGDALLGMLVMPVRYAILGAVVLYVAVPAMAAFAGAVKQAGCAVARWVWRRGDAR